jgi:hypothetical protein
MYTSVFFVILVLIIFCGILLRRKQSQKDESFKIKESKKSKKLSLEDLQIMYDKKVIDEDILKADYEKKSTELNKNEEFNDKKYTRLELKRIRRKEKLSNVKIITSLNQLNINAESLIEKIETLKKNRTHEEEKNESAKHEDFEYKNKIKKDVLKTEKITDTQKNYISSLYKKRDSIK